MTGVRWQYRPEGSGGPGRLQAVVPSGAYARYRAFMGHSRQCGTCEYGEARCQAARELWARYARACTPAA